VVALAQHSVEVMGDEPESPVFNAAIHGVVVTSARRQATFSIAHQGIGRQVSHPLLKVNDLADLGDKVVVGDVTII